MKALGFASAVALVGCGSSVMTPAGTLPGDAGGDTSINRDDSGDLGDSSDDGTVFNDSGGDVVTSTSTDSGSDGSASAGDAGRLRCGAGVCNAASEYCKDLQVLTPDGGDAYSCESLPACDAADPCSCLTSSVCTCTNHGGTITTVCTCPTC